MDRFDAFLIGLSFGALLHYALTLLFEVRLPGHEGCRSCPTCGLSWCP